MKRIGKILVPTDLSENSRRALLYGCGLAEEEKTSLIILHVANDLDPWQLHSDDLALSGFNHKIWPVDRLLAEAGLDLTRFLERSMQTLKRIPTATKRVALGPVAQQIAAVADEENVDLIIMSPRRSARLTTSAQRRHHGPRYPLKSLPGIIRNRAAANKVLARQICALVFRLAPPNNGADLRPRTLNLGSAEKSQRESIPLTTSMQCSTWDHLLRVNSSPASFVPSCLISWLQQPNGHNKKGSPPGSLFFLTANAG